MGSLVFKELWEFQGIMPPLGVGVSKEHVSMNNGVDSPTTELHHM